MFTNKRYTTKKIQNELPLALQLFIWKCIDNLKRNDIGIDYFQSIDLKIINDNKELNLIVTHSQEAPEYTKQYMLLIETSISEHHIYVIDDGTFSTMMFSSEY